MSVEMEKKHGDIRTDKFINKQDQTVNISFDEYRRLKHDASKWIMMEWAIDKKVYFITLQNVLKGANVSIDKNDLELLEKKYTAWLEEQRGVK
jgi:hypothetical protein